LQLSRLCIALYYGYAISNHRVFLIASHHK